MTLQAQIAAELGVAATFDAAAEAERRIDFLARYLRDAGQRCYVLGISGGIDSTCAGRLAQLAVERLRAEGRPARFVAMRLPYGMQRDEADAQRALAFIRPDEVLTVDVRPASDAMLAALRDAGLAFDDPAHEDFVLGNVKARQRMIAQYAVAGARRGLVIGTDQAAEALMGFFTKHGDGACDLVPLAGLNKRRVRAIARTLGALDELVNKVPTADLESLSPLKPDEVAYGVTYEQIDDYLEGRPIDARAAAIVETAWRNTAHKRALPPHP
ncbi:MAG TPA: ammonia-dependent NAD(+) synthetase [Burkholderiaceae bacterium]|nr:ammonia-dependent NAD(+) synthetase [Burkholderiaceae bacterium]